MELIKVFGPAGGAGAVILTCMIGIMIKNPDPNAIWGAGILGALIGVGVKTLLRHFSGPSR